MHEALVKIVVATIKDKYYTEKAFYSEELRISGQSWDRWKKGDQGLRYENMMIISTLFTDYEWMLVQKVAQAASSVSQTAKNPYHEYNFIKFLVAKKWVQQGMAEMHWVQTAPNDEQSIRKSHHSILQVVADYNLWGYNDIIEFRLPQVVRQEIETRNVPLLEWFEQASDGDLYLHND